MLLNRVRFRRKSKWPAYFDRIQTRFLPLRRGIFLICDTLLLIQPRKLQQTRWFFNISRKY
ncbi:hypothetical protein DN619_16515 [Klebsiella michiganensis]|nr:hypothetical protein DN619_16515 [Klebsiella michiganensis]